jgi:hypothetical protein
MFVFEAGPGPEKIERVVQAPIADDETRATSIDIDVRRRASSFLEQAPFGAPEP